jgi:Ser/Thr protein kinase RdoA (MazF antagonist)
VEVPFDMRALASWGDVDLVARASGGYANEVWFARVRGRDCVVRAAKRSATALEWELDVLHDLASHGIDVPELVPTLEGESSRNGIVVFRRLTGERPVSPADWVRVRDYLTRTHEALRGRRQRPDFVSAVDLLVATRGGLVDLETVPDDVVHQCRAAWQRLVDRPQTVIHGDPGVENIFVNAGGVVLIDWDEARVDTPLFDYAALPEDVSPLDDEERWIATQAASAWEAAIAWHSDPKYALWRLSQVEAAP